MLQDPVSIFADECIELCSEIIGEEFEDTGMDIQLDEISKPGNKIKNILGSGTLLGRKKPKKLSQLLYTTITRE